MHGVERMASHDVVWDVFVTIVRNVGFHVLREQIHVFSPFTLQFLHRWVDIVLLVNGVYTLAKIVIANPIQIDLVLWAILYHGVVTTVMI